MGLLTLLDLAPGQPPRQVKITLPGLFGFFRKSVTLDITQVSLTDDLITGTAQLDLTGSKLVGVLRKVVPTEVGDMLRRGVYTVNFTIRLGESSSLSGTTNVTVEATYTIPDDTNTYTMPAINAFSRDITEANRDTVTRATIEDTGNVDIAEVDQGNIDLKGDASGFDVEIRT